MKFILPILTASLLMACGDKDEDTAADSAAPAEDTAAQ